MGDEAPVHECTYTAIVGKLPDDRDMAVGGNVIRGLEVRGVLIQLEVEVDEFRGGVEDESAAHGG